VFTTAHCDAVRSGAAGGGPGGLGDGDELGLVLPVGLGVGRQPALAGGGTAMTVPARAAPQPPRTSSPARASFPITSRGDATLEAECHHDPGPEPACGVVTGYVVKVGTVWTEREVEPGCGPTSRCDV